MDLTSIFTDDQLAVIGCFVAIGACGLVAAITFHTGAAGRKSQATSENSVRIRVPDVREQPSETRRAA